jgi:hypothetical protein
MSLICPSKNPPENTLKPHRKNSGCHEKFLFELTSGKVRNGAENATVAVQRSGVANAPRSMSTREDVELDVDESSEGDGVLQGIQ